MIPHRYVCSGCQEEFTIEPRRAVYDLDFEPRHVDYRVRDENLLEIPVRPAWCKTCARITVVEDIAPLRVFEDAYAAVRAGRHVEYPQMTEGTELAAARDLLAVYLKWRLGRRHAARALCCGGERYQFLDVEQPLFKHAQCDLGFVGPRYQRTPYCLPWPGIPRATNTPVHDGEGNLVGKLTWREQGSDIWQVESAHYPPPDED